MTQNGEYVDEKESSSFNESAIEFIGLLHVGFLCENLERSLEFYNGLLGLPMSHKGSHDTLNFRGAKVGSEKIHLLELPNPDPVNGRPAHGGRDRHVCVAVKDITKVKNVLERAGIQYTASQSGGPAIFARDPDGNTLEFALAE